jgi:hypothetical protein
MYACQEPAHVAEYRKNISDYNDNFMSLYGNGTHILQNYTTANGSRVLNWTAVSVPVNVTLLTENIATIIPKGYDLWKSPADKIASLGYCGSDNNTAFNELIASNGLSSFIGANATCANNKQYCNTIQGMKGVHGVCRFSCEDLSCHPGRRLINETLDKCYDTEGGLLDLLESNKQYAKEKNICFVKDIKYTYFDGPTQCPVTLTTGGNWSDPLSWPLMKVPEDFEDVVIEPYMTVILDVDTAKLGKLTIYGSLVFGQSGHAVGEQAAYEDRNLTLNLLARDIEVWGTLRIGHAGREWSGKEALISLWGEDDRYVPGETGGAYRQRRRLQTYGSRPMQPGRTLSIFGEVYLAGKSVVDNYARLKATAMKGAIDILTDSPFAVDQSWGVGVEIAISATTEYRSRQETKVKCDPLYMKAQNSLNDMSFDWDSADYTEHATFKAATEEQKLANFGCTKTKEVVSSAEEQTEFRTIKAVNVVGSTVRVTLDRPLNFTHVATSSPFQMGAHVGLLTRNVKVVTHEYYQMITDPTGPNSTWAHSYLNPSGNRSDSHAHEDKVAKKLESHHVQHKLLSDEDGIHVALYPSAAGMFLAQTTDSYGKFTFHNVQFMFTGKRKSNKAFITLTQESNPHLASYYNVDGTEVAAKNVIRYCSFMENQHDVIRIVGAANVEIGDNTFVNTYARAMYVYDTSSRVSIFGNVIIGHYLHPVEAMLRRTGIDYDTGVAVG